MGTNVVKIVRFRLKKRILSLNISLLSLIHPLIVAKSVFCANIFKKNSPTAIL